MYACARTLCRRVLLLDEGLDGAEPFACFEFETAEDLRELGDELYRRGVSLMLCRRRCHRCDSFFRPFADTS